MSDVLLGDRIELALIRIGLSKERWAAFTQQFGWPPTGDCEGCDHRQEVINDADLWMRHAAAELGSAAATAISKIWAPISWLRGQVQSGISSPAKPTIDGPTMKD